VGLAVQADPVRGCGAAGRGGAQGAGDSLGEVFEAGGEVQVAAEPGPVEALVDLRNLAAQGGDLDGQGGQALTESLRGRFSLRAGHRPPHQSRRRGSGW
jgi:hypothetical protein